MARRKGGERREGERGRRSGPSFLARVDDFPREAITMRKSRRFICPELSPQCLSAQPATAIPGRQQETLPTSPSRRRSDGQKPGKRTRERVQSFVQRDLSRIAEPGRVRARGKSRLGGNPASSREGLPSHPPPTTASPVRVSQAGGDDDARVFDSSRLSVADDWWRREQRDGRALLSAGASEPELLRKLLVSSAVLLIRLFRSKMQPQRSKAWIERAAVAEETR